MSVVICSVKDAFKLMGHMEEDDIVVLSVINKKTYIHKTPERIKKVEGEELIKQAHDILYQDNDFFGTFSLYGILKEEDIIHNIQFPQLSEFVEQTFRKIY